MRWIKLHVQDCYRGTTFTELSNIECGIWFKLLVIAGVSPDEGYIYLRNNEGYDLETLSKLINSPLEELENALKRLVEVNKILILPSKIIRIVNWKQYQDNYRTYEKTYILKDDLKLPLSEQKINRTQEEEEEEEEEEKKNSIKNTIVLSEFANSVIIALSRCQKIKIHKNDLIKIIPKWEDLYAKSQLDIQYEITQADLWLINHKRSKSLYGKYLTNWFNKALEKPQGRFIKPQDGKYDKFNK